MREPDDQITYMLEATANVTVTSAHGLGRDAAMPEGEFPLAEISESLDDQTCQLCRMLDGQIVRRDSPEYDEFRWPSHINCRRIMIYIGKDEIGLDGQPVQPAFVRPDDDIIAKHGHFHVDPNKYRELRIPSRPEGRDFIFSPGPKGEPGALLWAPGLSWNGLKSTLLDMLDAGGKPADLLMQMVSAKPIPGINVGTLTPDLDLRTMMDAWNQLDALVDGFPEGTAAGDITFTMGLPSRKGAFADWSSRDRTITMSSERWSAKYASHSEGLLDVYASPSVRAFPEAIDDVRGVVSHEYGHSVFDGIEQPFALSQADETLAEELSKHTLQCFDDASEVFADCFAVVARTPARNRPADWGDLVMKAYHAMGRY